MDPNLKKVLDKVQKLLALKGNNSNPNEAALAGSKAKELIDKYNLSKYIVESAAGELGVRDKITDGWSVQFYLEKSGKRRSVWRNVLASGIARLNECRIYNMNILFSEKRKEVYIVPIGTESDMYATKSLFVYLRDEIERLCKRDNDGYGKSWANNYKQGAVQIIIERLEEEREKSLDKIEKEITEDMQQAGVKLVHVKNALARLDEKQKAVDEFMKSRNLDDKSYSETKYDRDGYIAGRLAGREINLSNKKLEDGKKKLKG